MYNYFLYNYYYLIQEMDQGRETNVASDKGIINYNLYNLMKVLINQLYYILYVISDVSGNERLMVQAMVQRATE